MMCRNCSNPNPWHTVSKFDSSEGVVIECCDKCGLEGQGEGVPDVYLRRVGQTFANLCDDMGRPYEIQSKRHKKEVMDRLGVSEAGGTVNGAPFGTKSWIDGTRKFREGEAIKQRRDRNRA